MPLHMHNNGVNNNNEGANSKGCIIIKTNKSLIINIQLMRMH